jgi:phosphoribosylaminoimidazolecarboxamide formyltransferase/IMP cyclohydrolase
VRALISVWDKTGLDRFAAGLAELGHELVASGGTAAYLEELGLAVTPVEDLTEVPELLGGRVKTLHPAVHAGILARRDREDDLAALDEHAIEPFDVVCVNLYPFERAREVEMIDVGGPALLRAAAKNHAHVAAVSRPEQYEAVLVELQTGTVSDATRRRLAADAFALTATYDAAIAAWLEDEELPSRPTVALEKELDLAYGENPHQRAAYYAERGAAAHLLSGVEQLHGKPLSYNNLNDLAAARLLLRELDAAACVIVKHANPCGAAEADTAEAAYERALACDPLSAYGGVVVLDRPVDESLGGRLAQQFLEVLLAPDYDEAALSALQAKPALRILRGGEELGPGLAYRSVPGGVLVQERDAAIDEQQDMQVVCGEPTEEQWRDLVFAWRVCKHVASNAIVLAKHRMAIGIGAGQQSRVDAVRLAVDKARERVHDLSGAALASDAFFPFADGPGLALEAGIRAIVQPGGSKRDDEVIDAVRKAGAAMVFGGRRHFRH